jgi:hypothetical protein
MSVLHHDNARAHLLSAWIGDESPVSLVIGVYPADQLPGWLNEEFRVLMCFQLGFADQEPVAAVAVVCGPRCVTVV